LYALSCFPDLRVGFWSACIVNGVRYNTVHREKYLQTQNSGVMTPGTHGDAEIDFYGVLNEIIELQYNVTTPATRSVVLFGCDWYNQVVGKTTGIRDDGHFKSINIQSLWYKSDPYILATQSKKVFYMEDTALGKNWRVVQKFEHRDVYNVAEKSDLVYQEDRCSHTVQQGEGDGEVQQGDGDEVEVNNQDGKYTRIDGRLHELIRNKKRANISVDAEEEEDDTVMEYFSDNGNENAEDEDEEVDGDDP